MTVPLVEPGRPQPVPPRRRHYLWHFVTAGVVVVAQFVWQASWDRAEKLYWEHYVRGVSEVCGHPVSVPDWTAPRH